MKRRWPRLVRGELDHQGQAAHTAVDHSDGYVFLLTVAPGVEGRTPVKYTPEKVEDLIQALKDARAEALRGTQWPMSVVLWVALLGVLVERLTTASGSAPW